MRFVKKANLCKFLLTGIISLMFALNFAFISRGLTFAQESVGDITEGVLESVTGNPAAEACRKAELEQDSPFCQQLKSDATTADNCTRGTNATDSSLCRGFVLDTIMTIANILVVIITALSVVFALYGVVKYATSGGKPESVAAARKTIIYALVGFALALSAGFILRYVLSL